MDEIFTRMNIAIKAKNLDPMDLKLLPNADKMPRLQQTTFYGVTNVSILSIYTLAPTKVLATIMFDLPHDTGP